jgi:hypothetical protein
MAVCFFQAVHGGAQGEIVGHLDAQQVHHQLRRGVGGRVGLEGLVHSLVKGLQLNGHYEGGASGETFNRAEKTDILIRSGDRNVFIAECKFWRGQKGFNEAVDQLLSYLTWRDSKCALLIFNTTKDSAGVRAKMHEVLQARPEYKKTVFHKPDGDSRYILIKPSEPGKEIVVTTQLYDVPTR